MSVWNFVSSLQATLDDAAGVDTRGDGDVNGRGGDEDDFGLGDEYSNEDGVGGEGSVMSDDYDDDKGTALQESEILRDPPQAAAGGGEGWGDGGSSLDLSYGSDDDDGGGGGGTVAVAAAATPIAATAVNTGLHSSNEESQPLPEVIEDGGDNHTTSPATRDLSRCGSSGASAVPPTGFPLTNDPDTSGFSVAPKVEEILPAATSTKTVSERHHDDHPARTTTTTQAVMAAGVVGTTVLPTAVVDTIVKNINEEEASLLRRANSELEGELKRLKLRLAKMGEKLQSVQSKANVRADEILEEGKQLARDLEKEQSTVRVLLDERAKRETQILSLQSHLDKSETHAVALTDECEHLNNKVAALTTEISYNGEQHKRQIQDLKASLVSEYESTTEEVSANNMAALTSANDEIVYLHEEIAALRAQLEDTDARFVDKEAVIRGELERKLLSAEREVTDANQRAMIAESRALEATRSGVEEGRSLVVELDQTQQLNDRLQSVVQLKQDQLRKRDVEVDTLQAEIQSLRSSLNSTKQQLEEAVLGRDSSSADALQQKDRDVGELRHQLQAAIAQDRHQKETIRLLERSLAKAKSEKEELELLSVAAGGGGGGGGSQLPQQSTSASKSVFASIVSPTTATAAASSSTVNLSSSAPSTRVEMELAQTAAKLAEVTQHLSKRNTEHNILIGEHDVLMQLYGEKDEEVQLLTDKLDAIVGGGLPVTGDDGGGEDIVTSSSSSP